MIIQEGPDKWDKIVYWSCASILINFFGCVTVTHLTGGKGATYQIVAGIFAFGAVLSFFAMAFSTTKGMREVNKRISVYSSDFKPAPSKAVVKEVSSINAVFDEIKHQVEGK